MTAHTQVIQYGPGCAVICKPCGLEEHYLRWQPAQLAAKEHNATHHAKPVPA